MAAAPTAGHAAQAVAARDDDVPRATQAGASVELAARIAGNARRWWRNSRMGLNMLLPIAYFDRLGVPDSHDLNFSNRPVRTRMPGGVGGDRSAMIGPYPDCEAWRH